MKFLVRPKDFGDNVSDCSDCFAKCWRFGPCDSKKRVF